MAKLNPRLGQALDSAGIAFRWIRYIAQGDGYAMQQRRFDEVMQRHAKRRAAEAEAKARDLTCTPEEIDEMRTLASELIQANERGEDWTAVLLQKFAR